jgi:hypothetical protein
MHESHESELLTGYEVLRFGGEPPTVPASSH